MKLEPEARELVFRLLTFCEYLADQLNNMDAVEPEDEDREGGVLQAVREALGIGITYDPDGPCPPPILTPEPRR